MGLAGLSSIGESSRNSIDHPSYLLGRFLFLWILSIVSWLIVSLSSSFFCFVSSSVYIVIPMLLLLVSFESRSYLVVV